MNASQTFDLGYGEGKFDMLKDQSATPASDLLGELQESDERDVTLLSELSQEPVKVYSY